MAQPANPTSTPRKRRTRQALNLRGCSEYRERPDGTWEAYFPVLDVRAAGATEDAVRMALRDAVDDRINNGDDDARRRFQAWAADNVIDVEITEEEYQRERVERLLAGPSPSSGLPQLTPQTFDNEVASSTPTLVDYWAAWCEPCHAMAPILQETAANLEGRLRVFGVDVEEHEQLWERFDLMGVPTMIVFRHGKEVKRILGSRSAQELLDELVPVLDEGTQPK